MTVVVKKRLLKRRRLNRTAFVCRTCGRTKASEAALADHCYRVHWESKKKQSLSREEASPEEKKYVHLSAFDSTHFMCKVCPDKTRVAIRYLAQHMKAYHKNDLGQEHAAQKVRSWVSFKIAQALKNGNGERVLALRMKFAATAAEENEAHSFAVATSASLRKGLQKLQQTATTSDSDSLMRKRLQELLLLKAAPLERVSRKMKRTPTPTPRKEYDAELKKRAPTRKEEPRTPHATCTPSRGC